MGHNYEGAKANYELAKSKGLSAEYTKNNYVYLVDENGNPIPFFGMESFTSNSGYFRFHLSLWGSLDKFTFSRDRPFSMDGTICFVMSSRSLTPSSAIL